MGVLSPIIPTGCSEASSSQAFSITMRAMAKEDHGNPGGGFFKRLRERINGGRGLGLSLGFAGRKLDDELAEELETELLMADVGVDAADQILSALRKKLGRASIDSDDQVRELLCEVLADMLRSHAQPLQVDTSARPYVILVVGVNGSGKTTTIGKLARRLKDEGYSVMLAAGDTYRAAAIEQLQAWGERNAVPVVAQQPGADPAAVIYDACEAARARGIDVLLADTAGRLQNKAGLMAELEKVVRIAGRLDPAAPHEKMLVLDSSLGQNAISQAVEFDNAIGLTGLTMTKLDGGAKGGVLISLAERLDLPFRFIGVGEQAEDMDVFDADAFAAALVGSKAP
jgi:fused signal recognition particle receptor